MNSYDLQPDNTSSPIRGVRFLYKLLIHPTSLNEDSRRKEFVLNTILVGTLVLFFILAISVAISHIKQGFHYAGISSVVLGGTIFAFSYLLILSRKGFFRISSYILLAVYFLFTMYDVMNWSFVLPMIILGSVVIIVVSSILINIRFGFVATACICLATGFITWMQINHIIPVDLYWQHSGLSIQDVIEMSAIFFLIATVSWLSNRELERSLIRLRKSEAELILERNSLEQRVHEQTRELKALQMDQVLHLSRFAEFGRLASGVFHDLMNPLNAVIANIDRMDSTHHQISETKEYVHKAVTASHRMGTYLGNIRNQIKSSGELKNFLLSEEAQNAIDILAYKARMASVVITIENNEEIIILGEPLKFNQVIQNLLSNAIDAYQNSDSNNRIVILRIFSKNNFAVCEVQDYGCGMSPETQSSIFEPFFTTKDPSAGLGIGLATIHEIVTVHFKGTISVTSILGQGSVFSVTFPIHLSSY